MGIIAIMVPCLPGANEPMPAFATETEVVILRSRLKDLEDRVFNLESLEVVILQGHLKALEGHLKALEDRVSNLEVLQILAGMENAKLKKMLKALRDGAWIEEPT